MPIKLFNIIAISFTCVFVNGCASKTALRVSDDARHAQQMVIDGKCLWELGKLDEAELKLQGALEIETNNVAAAYYLGLIHRERIEHRRPAIFTYHRTTVTNHQTMPLQQRTLVSFGSFDSSTTVEDVMNRVGQPDWDWNISGLHTYSYRLAPPNTNCVYIQTDGPSFIYRVTSGNTVLYARGTNDW